ncbi:MAG TPA: hypothetical protein VHR17_06665, partial [Thermoanaerobaculia bacterium]|nr:hypothetical protein [Thermoanaerobaculia bacterium]
MADRNRPTALLCTLAVLSLSLGALGQEIPLGSEFQINTYTVGYQLIPAVALGPDGAFIVAWLNEGAASSFFIFARRFSSAGVPLASEFQVNSYTLNFLSVVAAAADADGDAIVVWSQHLGGPYHLFARRFSSVGSPLTGELQVNSHTIQGWGPLPVVASDAAGNFVVVWHDRRS